MNLITALKTASKRKDMAVIEINNGKIYATTLDTTVTADIDFKEFGMFDAKQFCDLYKNNFNGLNVVDDVYYHNKTPLSFAKESKLDAAISNVPKCETLVASISPAQFKNLFSDVDKWMGKHDVRFYLNGSFITFYSNNEIKLVASTGHTLAQNQVVSDSVFKEVSCIINRESIELLKSMKPEKNVHVYHCEPEEDSHINFFKFVVDGIEITCKTFDTKYPDFGRVFSQLFETSLSFNSKEVLKQLASIKPLLSNTKGVILKSDSSGNVSAFVDNTCVCELSILADREFECGFAYEYLINLFKRPNCDNYTLKLAHDGSCIWLSSSVGYTHYESIVMAMRL